jgi:uncharacterized protein (TIGR02996 family)
MTLPAALLGLLEDCKCHPEDDAPRLILADWLDEHDQPDRAEVVRLQCGLADLTEEEQRGTPEWHRVQELLARHHDAWLGPFTRPGWAVTVERGLVGLTVPARTLLADAGRLAACEEWVWVEQVRVEQSAGVLDEVLASPLLRRVGRLALPDNPIGPLAQALDRAPALETLSGLNLYRCDPAADGVAVLAGIARLGQLATLNLNGNREEDVNRLGSAGVRALAESPYLGRLRSLSLAENGLAAEDLLSLVAPWLSGLQRLNLRSNRLHDRGAEILPAVRPVPALTHLALADNGIGSEGARALAFSPLLENLVWLNLHGNRLGGESVRDLVRSRRLARVVSLRLSLCECGNQGLLALACHAPASLRRLNVAQNGLGPEAGNVLAGGAALAGLTSLAVGWNGLTDYGVTKLLASPHLGRLTELDLTGVGLTAAGLRALVKSPLQKQLTSLDLWSNGIFSSNLDALLSAPCLGRLLRLDLGHCNLDERDAAVLATTPALGQLRDLGLGGNHLGPAAAERLARWPGLSRLTSLDLSGNPLGSEGVLALARSGRLGHIQRLDLESTQMDSAALRPPLAALSPDALVELSLTANAFTDADVPALLRLADFRRLRHLGVWSHGFSDAARQTLRDRLGAVVVV